MTTQESIEATYQSSEISSLLAEIVDELKLSPPCDVTNANFRLRLICLIRHNRKYSEILTRCQSSLIEVMKL